jgi:hypothetical protein
VEPGPLPPHERPWRHPSELGPPSHEPTSTTGRVLIVTSATISLILIGLLAIAVTPDRSPPPIAASSTIDELSPRSAPAAIASSSALTTTTRPSLPVVTPVGDEGWAVTTWEAIAGETGWMDARLPSGEVVNVEVVGTDPAAGLVVVTLPASAETAGYELASDRPEPSDTVYVNASQPKVVTLVDLAYLEVEEATPVLDGAGALIGLCTGSDDGTTLMTVDTMPGDDGPDAPVDSTTPTVDTVAPETTASDSTAPTESTTPDAGETGSSIADETTVPSTTPDSTDPESTVADSTVLASTPPGPTHGR